jgi:two-component system, NtrC family, response regulator AtoC
MSSPVHSRPGPLTEAGFLCGQSVAIQSVNAVVAEIAGTDIPVLLLGESGTGKDVYARVIHRLSGSSEAPLKKLSCVTQDTRSLEAQLQQTLKVWGQDRQAGTLFLDGVDELDVACQRTLVSLLPDGDLKGGQNAQVGRIISSASRNLEREIETGRFRRELYFRISAVRLRLPPLRERKEDIAALFEFFLLKHAEEQGQEKPTINNEVIDFLTSYRWPGNIRELENVAKKIVALGETELALADLRDAPLSMQESSPEIPSSSLKVAARTASRRTERELILKALHRNRWNRKRAAFELQISYKALLYKIKQIGVHEPGSEEL